MNLRLPLKITAVALALAFGAAEVIAQGCTNTTLYPGATIVPNSLGGITQISTCNYLQEYSAVGPVMANGNYEFTVTGGGYITVREGTPTGPVIAEGSSPLTATATVVGTLYAHWNADASCGISSGTCQITTVQLLLNCTPPMATVTATDDCPNNEFSLNVNITSLGDATDVDLIYSVNGGADQTLADQQVGSVTIGPFIVGEIVSLTVTHSSDPLCNLLLTGLQSGNTCPTIVQCGGAPLDQTYCYVNSDNNHWRYQSTTGDALIMIFSAGSIESSNWDHIRIYNGPDNLSPLLYENPTGTTQLAGLQVIAPSGEIYMENSSDGSGSCQSGGFAEWVWQVGCLDCTGALATYTVLTDCDNYEFSVEVNITNIGSGADATITNNGGAAPLTVTTPGVYTVGPFTANIPVIVTVENPDNALCNASSNALVNPLCPTPVPCGGAPLDETYCYINNDSHNWHWQSSTGDALIMIFSAGSIESNFWDNIRIYNGPDNLSPLLYQNPTGTTQLAGLQVIAPSGHIYMENTSDGSGSCQSGGFVQWVWQVGCLDCTGAAATYTVVTDCANFEFSVDVNITNIGSGADATITNNGGAAPLTVTTAGVYTVGPFTANIPVIISVENPDNVLCNVSSPAMVNPLCPTPVVCGGASLQETYCYINNDSHVWHWESTGGQPLALQFSAGTLESFQFDNLRIYDGPNNLSPLLYQTTLPFPGTDLTGLLVISTGPNVYMENSSDGSVSCQSGSQTEWAWEVGCLDCTNPGATFSIVEDCIHHAFSVAVNVDSLGSGAFVRIANSLSTDTLTNVPVGITMVGPFPMDSLVSLTVMNETNNLCRIFSPEFTSNSAACVDTACAATAYEYCYTNVDTAWFAYQGLPGTPLTIEFLWGNLMADDFVQIYNGWVPLASELEWQGNLNGNMAGFAINTANNNDKMLMRIVSNEAYSCATGEAALPLHWVVQCGLVGVNENMATTFSMFPNPTNGELSLQLPTSAHGAVEMKVLDLSGRTVHHETFNSTGGVNTFDLGNLQSGNYVVTITTNDWVKSQKLQIIR